jgi:hypothetical protein
MQQTVITREMATQFIDIYHKTVYIHQCEDDYSKKNYTDEFYEGCMMNAPLFKDIRSMTDIDAYPFVQAVYDTIHLLMSPDYCLASNINYCIDYVNIDAQAVHYLNAANLNYHVLHKVHSKHYYNIAVCYEDLNDATLEPNICSVCQYENNSKPAESQHLKKFYYSSVFSLNSPVCQDCLLTDDAEKEAMADKTDPDYKPFVFVHENKNDESIDAVDAYYTSASEAGTDASDAEAYDLDAELDAYDDAELDSYDDADNTINENIVLTNTYSAVPYDYDAELRKAQAEESDNDAERCYAFAWQGGWDAAMKYVAERSLAASCCEYCGKEGQTKKCGGTCNGKVRYCSVECQTADWKQVHKYACLKHF